MGVSLTYMDVSLTYMDVSLTYMDVSLTYLDVSLTYFLKYLSKADLILANVYSIKQMSEAVILRCFGQ